MSARRQNGPRKKPPPEGGTTNGFANCWVQPSNPLRNAIILAGLEVHLAAQPPGGTQMQEISRCTSCDYQTQEAVRVCPKCGRRVRTTRQSRILGWFQIVLGTFLVALMSVITFLIAGVVAQSGRPGATAGSSSDLAMIYGIFAVVIAIGLVTIAAGIMTIRYGKTNKIVMLLMILLALVFYIMAMAFNRSNSRTSSGCWKTYGGAAYTVVWHA
jgi:hypothetical protein